MPRIPALIFFFALLFPIILAVLINPSAVQAQTCDSWIQTVSSVPACGPPTNGTDFCSSQGYDYCQATTFDPLPQYWFRCCYNPTPTPTPTSSPTPTPTNTPTPSPSPTPTPILPTPTPAGVWCNASGGIFCGDSSGDPAIYSYCANNTTYYRVSCNATPACTYGSLQNCPLGYTCTADAQGHNPTCIAPIPTPTPTPT